VSEHKSLPAALLAFHANPPHIALDGRNPHFKSPFATFKEVTGKTRPRLVEEGLVVAQPLGNIDGAPAITTVLMHAASGESIEGVTPLLLGGKSDPQTWGSAITYAKRYGWLAILGLVGDEDDDANAATVTKPAAKKSGAAPGGSKDSAAPDDNPFDGSDAGVEATLDESKPAPFTPPGDGITEPQMKMLNRLVTKLVGMEALTVESLREGMKAEYGVTSKKELTKKQAINLISRLKALAGEEEK
jgi:hypothetical protein